MMMGLSLGLVTTGILMAKDINKETVEEVHELFANAFILVVIGHVVGLVLHTLKHKEMIGLSMVNGKKETRELKPGNEVSRHVGPGVLFVILLVAYVAYLNKSFDAQTGILNFFGTPLQLSEGGESNSMEKNESEVQGENELAIPDTQEALSSKDEDFESGESRHE